MAQKTKAVVKLTFETGDNPTQQEFYDWIESCSFQTEWKYYIKTGNTAEDDDGNWRTGFDGADLVTQKRKAGVWVDADKYIF